MREHPTTVLFIDPHQEDRKYWAQRLHILSSDYRILEAETGKNGLAICRSHRIDCIVTELTLPDMSGFELLIKLVPSVRCPENAVVILTRLNHYSMDTLALNNGAQAYLIKCPTARATY